MTEKNKLITREVVAENLKKYPYTILIGSHPARAHNLNKLPKDAVIYKETVSFSVDKSDLLQWIEYLQSASYIDNCILCCDKPINFSDETLKIFTRGDRSFFEQLFKGGNGFDYSLRKYIENGRKLNNFLFKDRIKEVYLFNDDPNEFIHVVLPVMQ